MIQRQHKRRLETGVCNHAPPIITGIHADRMLMHDHLLQPVGLRGRGRRRLLRETVKSIRAKQGDGANDPAHIFFTVPRVGYRQGPGRRMGKHNRNGAPES